MLLSVEKVTLFSEIYASSISVHEKYHPNSLAGLYPAELSHIFAVYRNLSLVVVHNRRYSRKYFSLCGL